MCAGGVNRSVLRHSTMALRSCGMGESSRDRAVDSDFFKSKKTILQRQGLREREGI